MPIHEFYCPDNHRIYQFYARTLAQGASVPKCPDNPRFRMRKLMSAFAVVGNAPGPETGGGAGAEAKAPGGERLEAAMGEMEREMAGVDENDPRAMGRVMRRMAELTGDKISGEMEEVVRKLEEGADPESLEAQMGAETPDARPEETAREARQRFRAARGPAARDPQLYDYS
jgi:hypothetical protein